MTVTAYYNEIDPYAAQWLRNLIDAGHLPAGDVDERDIRDVRASDLAGYTQCHFFAGIGGWPHALRLAGWPDSRPVWTGSCPCQPFSCAGKRKGSDDERHLWPVWRILIGQCAPPVCFGEQVASADGRDWLAGVERDLEDMGYRVAAADLCAAGVGAPHRRQRLWFVADAGRAGDERRGRPADARRTAGAPAGEARERERRGSDPRRGGGVHGLADAVPTGRAERRAESGGRSAPGCGGDDGRGHAERQGLEGLARDGTERNEPGRDGAGAPRPVAPAGADNVWTPHGTVWCDERALGRGWVARRVEPGTFPLATGVPGRVGRLRAYGNAIVPQVAAAFIRAATDCGVGLSALQDYSTIREEVT